MLAVVILIAAAGAYVAFAQQDGNMPGRRGGMMGRRGMMDGRMRPWRMCEMHRMMGRSMMEERFVPTSDGGVAILAGHKLVKYDSGLNVVKEVEVKVDYDAMEQQMRKRMGDCPGCRQMSQSNADDPDPDAEP